MFKTYFNKLFLGGNWDIAIKYKSEKYFNIKYGNDSNFWYADPFLFENDGLNYLICEKYVKSKDKGVINLFRIESDLELVNLGTIIEESYHLSYPHVFKNKNDIYMIPESSGNKTIDLYKCIDFPMKWVKVKTLLSDIYAVDSNTLYSKYGNYLFTYVYYDKRPYLEVYKIDNDFNVELVHKELFRDNVGRGAGNINVINDLYFRPTQNQTVKYGESIIINEVNLSKNMEHKKVDSLDISKVKILGKKKYTRIHTYNCMNEIEVIDVRFDKFDPLLFIKKIRRRFYNKGK